MELKGTGVSPGTAFGQALVMDRETAPVFRLLVPPDEVEREVQRLNAAIEASRKQLRLIKDRLSREVGLPHSYIFDAQLLMLDDPLLLDRSVAIIRDEHVNGEWALRTVSEQLHALFDEFTDSYIRERKTDLDDVLGRLQLNLAGAERPSSRWPDRFVLVASDLTPSEAGELDWEHVLAVATDAGSQTYHTAILARSLGIPGVVGLKEATRLIPPGSFVVVDGTRGRVVVEPSAAALEEFRQTQEKDRREQTLLQGTRSLPAVTRDGLRISLQANVEFFEDVGSALLYGAEGIGLFRSEYMLGRFREWPDEDKQVDVYRRLVEQVRPYPVTVRTWDVGPEDLAPGGASMANPALGERALRLLGKNPQVFRTQLRAILRAAAHGPLRIMFPFLGGPAEVSAAIGLIETARDELRRAGLPFGSDVPVGLNLEIPSAALTADLMPEDVEFFSIGTNDLIQYLLAVDRSDPRVSALYAPLHPAVLRTIHGIVQSAHRRKVSLSVCGEMAADPLHALVLVGLGVRELSTSPAAIPRVKAVLRSVTGTQLETVAKACLSLGRAEQIEELLRRELAEALLGAEPAEGGKLVPDTEKS